MKIKKIHSLNENNRRSSNGHKTDDSSTSSEVKDAPRMMSISRKRPYDHNSKEESSSTRTVTIKVDSTEIDMFVRLDKNKELPNIAAASEEGSRKALEMESGGARHFFSVLDGITVPGKIGELERDGFYHFYSPEIAKNKHWVDGKSSSVNLPKMENVKFHANEAMQARSEFAIKEHTITEGHVISIPIGFVDGHIRNGDTCIKFTYKNELTDRSCKFVLELKKLINDIRLLKTYGNTEYNLKLPKL